MPISCPHGCLTGRMSFNSRTDLVKPLPQCRSRRSVIVLEKDINKFIHILIGIDHQLIADKVSAVNEVLRRMGISADFNKQLGHALSDKVFEVALQSVNNRFHARRLKISSSSQVPIIPQRKTF